MTAQESADREVTVDERRRAARVLSSASLDELAALWAKWEERPDVTYLRGPEAGLVMVQGRIGGTGDRFNLGEATVARATVMLHGNGVDGASGTSYVLGSHPEHAGLAAVFDALLCTPEQRTRVLTDVIEPLERSQHLRDASAQADARSTVVDFFTVAREHE
ncbi:phosphonate C-P lyase system protein PhnG [Microbacterium murale]|uniref:Alpha-D-ribose 1-methylphosphonate 5-triphosphate synthase subunit PhnG n=1 Tax=Microbacterium murale TaxID=1081040 RepID=A0ABU0PDM7_9MICO|nr:phosphonate C-P lyase system protein PhnG [Microbacterium murale]MDQ0644786.1 alpha-D-ribose 1-methylphosphonate 5-triphosphate synthase subunit PhnG [Microbacterium murale]